MWVKELPKRSCNTEQIEQIGADIIESVNTRMVLVARVHCCSKYWNIWYMGRPASPVSIGIYLDCFGSLSIGTIYAIFIQILICWVLALGGGLTD